MTRHQVTPGVPIWVLQTGIQCSYYRPKASYATHSQKPLASPQSIHTDMDVVMEFDNINVAPQGLAREMTTLDLVSCLTKGMANATAEVLEKFAQPPPVSAAGDAALWERIQQRGAMALQPPATK